jgi:tungstate transport system ATP-binding protein
MGLNLEVARIVKSYNGQAVLGQNGSGKSTFLRIAALLEAPDAGEVRYWDNGVALPHDLGLRRRITLLLPRIGVFNTSVFHNVAYGLKIRGRSSQEVEDRVKEALGRVGLLHKRRQNGLDLSSGETRRLGIARALIIDPEVFCLDEPTANLDPKNAEIIEQIIFSMKNAGKSTIIVVTHDPAQARRLCDQPLVMDHGRIAPL